MRFWRVVLTIVAFVYGALPALAAYDFSNADALFAQRGNGVPAIYAARSAYEATLNSISGEDKVYAIEQLSRLAYLEAIASNSNDTMKTIALKTYDLLAQIEDVGGKTPVQFYYWRAVCIAGWAKANGVLSSLSKSREIAQLIEAGNATDPSYEGGGFYRIGAALYAKLPPINPFGPHEDLNRASDYLQRSLSSPAFAGAMYPETSTGDYFFDIYEAQTEILLKEGRRQDAITLLQSVVMRIDKGDVSPDRIPEAQANRKNLQSILDRLR